MRTYAPIAAILLLVSPLGFGQEKAQEKKDQPVPGDAILLEDALRPGLVGQYWNVGKDVKKFPDDCVCGTPSPVRIDGMINFDTKEGRGFGDLPWKEQFAAVWTGMLRVPKDGEVTFTLKSHDGSKLYLNGTLFLDHDGIHPFKESAGKSVSLKKGDHEIRVEYFQNGKDGRCILSWKMDGMEKEVIPSTAFWHHFEKGVDPEAK